VAWGNGEPEHEKLTVDPRRTPERVIPGHARETTANPKTRDFSMLLAFSVATGQLSVMNEPIVGGRAAPEVPEESSSRSWRIAFTVPCYFSWRSLDAARCPSPFKANARTELLGQI
jgi:hypothetical protein